jgi:hypothetical protein
MDVGVYRGTGRQRFCAARWVIAGLLTAATLILTGCLPAAAGQQVDIEAPGQTGGVPASAQAPPPPPALPA